MVQWAGAQMLARGSAQGDFGHILHLSDFREQCFSTLLCAVVSDFMEVNGLHRLYFISSKTRQVLRCAAAKEKDCRFH